MTVAATAVSDPQVVLSAGDGRNLVADARAALPDPELEPTVDLWPTAGRALGIGRNSAYDAAARGEIPVIRVGRQLRVPTAALRGMLHLDAPISAA